MAADRIDSTLVAPIVPRTLVTPQRDRVAQQGTGDEVSISREARVLQALDTQANAEVYDEQPRRPELQRYLEAQSGTEQPAGNGQIIETHSISAGLDYPGVGPEHAWLKDSGRANYVAVTDDEAMQGFHDLTRIEGILPALESSHAIAYARKLAPQLGREGIMLINLSGRGDKDIQTIARIEGVEI